MIISNLGLVKVIGTPALVMAELSMAIKGIKEGLKDELSEYRIRGMVDEVVKMAFAPDAVDAKEELKGTDAETFETLLRETLQNW